ncbi:hypothetical protein DSO57_1028202 [Entomophthora muscae]|uniref:Uncharacterized protein n=1 Tax=Entomophthora muscae TaxID=34485 RepID=A0ACC2SEI9_9FUNG|nr:hypothetical protein DSO57_1028202 [Entomophthora muscae]
MDMELPVTSKPMPASAAKLSLDHTNKLFGTVSINLMGVIDTIVPAAGPWSWVGKSMSYLIKLEPILWWALPTQSATCQFPNASKPANQGWFPESQPWLHTLVADCYVVDGAECLHPSDISLCALIDSLSGPRMPWTISWPS